MIKSTHHTKPTRHGSLSEQLQALMAYRTRPEGDYEPLQTNWTVTPDNNNADPAEVADMRFERDWRQTPSVQEIMKQVATSDVERNEQGQIIRIGRLKFSDGNNTERGYMLGIDGVVIETDIRMPVGAMLGMRDKPERTSGGEVNPQEVKASNQYFEDMLGTSPHRYKSSGKRRNGQNYTAEQSAKILAEAYVNTDMSKVTYTRYPKGLPCGSQNVADSFLGMRKTTCAGGGSQSWEDISTALIDRDIWAGTVASLSERDVAVLESAMEAKNLTDIHGAKGGHKRNEEKRGKRSLKAANDNLAEFMKIFAA